MKKVTLLLLVVVLLAILIVNRTPAQTETPTTLIFPVYNTDGTDVPNAHIVVGQVSVPPGPFPFTRQNHQEFLKGIPVTLTGAASFTNAVSYKCFVTELGGPNPPDGMFKKVDGSHFAIRAPRWGVAWQQDFFCIGN